jgi:hypothetical protein
MGGVVSCFYFARPRLFAPIASRLRPALLAAVLAFLKKNPERSPGFRLAAEADSEPRDFARFSELFLP